MSSIEFLIISVVFFFLTFASVDYFTVLTQYQIAQHITNYYMERIRICGRLTTADETEMINKFNSIGLTVDSINTVRESQGQSAVIRNLSNPDQSKISVLITLKPNKRPFLVGTLIGGNAASDTFRFKIGGTVLSEKI